MSLFDEMDLDIQKFNQNADDFVEILKENES